MMVAKTHLNPSDAYSRGQPTAVAELRALLIEDNPGDARLVQEYLADAGSLRVSLTHVERLSDSLAHLANHSLDVVLVDLSLPDSNGLGTFMQVRDRVDDIPILVLTGSDDDELATDALQAGAQEYLVKGNFDQHALVRAIRYALERHQLVQQVRRSEARLRMIVEHNADSLVIIDRQGTVQYVNPAAEALFGRPAEKFVGQPFNFPISANGTERLEIIRNTGEVATAEMRIQPAEWDGESVYVASLRDVTEQVKTNTALAQSKALNEAVLRSMTAHIAVLDEDGIIIVVNEAWDTFACENGGPMENAFVGDNYLAVCRRATTSDTTAQHVLDGLEAVLGGERQSFSVEYPCHSPKERRWFRVHVTPLAGNGGIVVSHTAITDRVRAHQQLKESEQRYRLLAANATDMIARHTPDATIDYVSPASRRILGYEPEEIVGRHTLDLVHPEDRDEIAERLRDGLRSEDVQTFQFRARHKDGSYVWLESTGRAIIRPQTDDVPKGISISRDVTERYQRERELEAITSVARALREASDHTEMPPIILEQLFQLLDADRAGFKFIVGDAQDPVELTQDGKLLTPEEQTVSRRLAEEVVGTGELLRSEGHAGDTGDDVNTTEVTNDAMCSRAGVPLIADNRALGAIWMSRQTPFTDAELRVLGAVADIAANASNRAMLHAQREQRLQRIAALRKIDTAITGSTDQRVILSTVLEQAVDQLGVDAASVLLLDEHTMTLEHAAHRGFRTDEIVSSTVNFNMGGAGLAARERRVVHIDDLQEQRSGFSRLETLAAEGFVTYYAAPLIAKGKVQGVLETFLRRPFDANAEWIDFLEALAGQAAIAVDNTTLFYDLQRSNAELKLAYDATIEGWARALDLRDEETEGHTRRVTEMTFTLAKALGIRGEDLVHIRRGALLHDIGKMGIPDSILLKPGPLNDEEWEEMRRHPVYAYNLLSGVDFLRPALDIPYCHHEKWDGSGYPRGLRGAQIPLPARIFAVVDVYDALISDRPYRDAWPADKAIAHIREQAGEHFDPDVVDVFLEAQRNKR